VKTDPKQLVAALKKYASLATLIKGSPDPDAMACSFALKCVCDTLGIKNGIFAEKNISLPQNRALVDKLDIPIKIPFPADLSKFDAYMIFDYQQARIPDISEKLPCAVHIDHHDASAEDVSCDMRIVDSSAGSASTIVALLLKELDLEIGRQAMTRMCTALLYGIETDTDGYSHARKPDYEAIDYISKYSDTSLVKKISSIPLSKKTVSLLWTAMENITLYKDWLITGIGFIDESNRDSMPIIADFLTKREDVALVVVFAAVEKSRGAGLALDASFRTKNPGLDLDSIIKGITETGGARKFKGALQIDLDFFTACPDRDALWKIISATMTEALKKRRDGIYISGIKGYYRRLRNRIFWILKKGH